MSKNRLEQLIGTMEGTEKAYFRKFGFRVSTKGQAQLALFDIIEKQLSQKPKRNAKNFTEEQFRSGGFKNYQITRTKLYDTLLKTLCEHGKGRFPAHRFFTAIRNAHFLTSKGLYGKAEKLLTTNLSEAKAQSQPAIEQLLLKELNGIAIRNGNHEQIIGTIDAQIESMERAKQMAYLAKYYEQVFNIQRNYGILNASQKEPLRKLNSIDRKVKKMKTDGFMPSTSFNYYMLNQVIAFTLSNTPDALKFTELAFQITQSNPEIFKSRKGVAVSMLSNLIQDSLSIRDRSYYNRYISTLKTMPTQNSEMVKTRDSLVLKVEFTHDFFKGLFENYKHRWSDYQLIEEAFNDNTRVAVCSDIAHLAFISQDYRLCIRIINHLINLVRSLPRTDVINNMEMLLLLAHFELGNFDTVDQLILSLETRAQANQDLSEQSFDFVKLVKDINGLNDDKKSRSLLVKFVNQHQMHFKEQTVTSFNPVVWATSKSSKTIYRNEFMNFFDLPIE